MATKFSQTSEIGFDMVGHSWGNFRTYHERFGAHIAELKIEMSQQHWQAHVCASCVPVLKPHFVNVLFFVHVVWLAWEELPKSPFAAREPILLQKTDLELFQACNGCFLLCALRTGDFCEPGNRFER